MNEYHRIQHHCNECKKPLILKADKECPQNWIDSLCKLSVCNQCADIHEEQWRQSQNRKARLFNHKPATPRRWRELVETE
jgi:hypothetical protein